jgi:hypothetical protein
MLRVEAKEIDHDKLAGLAKEKAPTKPTVKLDKKGIKKVWDNYIVVNEVRKNDRLKFVLAAGTRDGYRCLSIREFYRRRSDKTWQPGREGILIPLKSPFYGDVKDNPNPTMIEPLYDLLKAIPEALKVVETMELYDLNNAVWQLPNTVAGTRVKMKEVKEDNNEDK